MTKVYVGDVGTLIQVETGQSMVGAISVSLSVKKPNGRVVSLAATINGTKLEFTSVLGTFDVEGAWLLQAKVQLPSGVWSGETAKFTVYPLFK